MKNKWNLTFSLCVYYLAQKMISFVLLDSEMGWELCRGRPLLYPE